MGTSALNVTIENLFKTGWGATTPISFENVPYIPKGVSWVEIRVKDGPSSKKSLGAGVQLRRSLGTVFITVYTAPKQGSKPARDLADQAAAIFRDKQSNGVTFYEPSIVAVGEVYHAHSGGSVPATDKWYQVKVSIPYFYDEYK